MYTAKANRNIIKLRPSDSIAMMEKARQLKAKGFDIISLAGGEPDFDTPNPVIEAGIKAIRDGLTHYTAGRGILPLRERIAQKLVEENGISCSAENILVTPGGKYAISIAISSFINPGDEVIILNPSWVSYAPMVEMAGGIPVNLPLSFHNNYLITEDLLEHYVSDRTRMMILNTPNNPTGRVLNEKEALSIRKFINRHDILLISDEVYEKIIFDDRVHISMAKYNDINDKVITVNSFSKCIAMTGWRIGYICAEKQVVDTIYLAYQHALTCISEFSQYAAIVALDCKDEMEMMRRSYEHRRNLVISRFQEIPGMNCLLPEGAFYAWCRIDKNEMTAPEICEYLLNEAQVVTVNGHAYGPGSEKCVRMCFATAEEDLDKAIRRIRQVISG